MKRTGLNLLIDLSAATCFVGMIATGYLLRFPLPPGTNKSLVLWGLTRHQWGEVHFWISLLLLTLMLIHLVLHWQWLVSVVARQFGAANPCQVRTFRSGVITLAVMTAGLATFAWLAETSVRQRNDPCCPRADVAAASPTQNLAQVGFRKDVYPIFETSCLHCHGPDRAQGGFRVDRKEDFFGKDGRPPLVIPGNTKGSRLLTLLSVSQNGSPAAIHQLPAAELDVLRAWIDAGAEWPEP